MEKEKRARVSVGYIKEATELQNRRLLYVLFFILQAANWFQGRLGVQGVIKLQDG